MALKGSACAFRRLTDASHSLPGRNLLPSGHVIRLENTLARPFNSNIYQLCSPQTTLRFAASWYGGAHRILPLLEHRTLTGNHGLRRRPYHGSTSARRGNAKTLIASEPPPSARILDALLSSVRSPRPGNTSVDTLLQGGS